MQEIYAANLPHHPIIAPISRPNSLNDVRQLISGHDDFLCGFFRQLEYAAVQHFNDYERKLITDHLLIKKYRKRQYFLQEGDDCSQIGFMLEGSAKMYSINPSEKETIISFFLEEDWVINAEGFINDQKSGYHVELLEDSLMVVFEHDRLRKLTQLIPSLADVILRIYAGRLAESQKRINSTLGMTARERYLDLINSKPGYATRFPQNMLACYLGIKPETLCRLLKDHNIFLPRGIEQNA